MKRKTGNKKIKIGYISPLEKSEIEGILKKHFLFENYDTTFFKCRYSSELKDGITNGDFDYIVSPCRSEENKISPIMMDIVSSMVTRKIIEIGVVQASHPYNHKERIIQDDELKNSNVINTFGDTRYYLENHKNFFHDEIDYKIFKKSSYKPNFFTIIKIFLFSNPLLSSLFAGLIIVFTLVIALLSGVSEQYEWANIFNDNFEFFATCFLTIFIALGQFINEVFKLKRSAELSLIKGRWLYYSYEEAKGNGSVPKGFKTRLLTITPNGENIHISCVMEGEDNLFFSTTQTAVEFDSKTKILTGFYEYTTNTINDKGRRAEGVCRFQGKRDRFMPIETLDGWFSSRGTQINGRVKYVRVSEKDYKILSQSNTFYRTQFKKPNCINIGIYGAKCSNTDVVARKWISKNKNFAENKTEIIYCYYEFLDKMKNDLKANIIQYAVVPEKNRNKLITNNLIFIEEKEFEKIETIKQSISYVLASSIPNFILKDDTIFMSHPEALKQCQRFINNRPTIKTTSTSAAARELKFFIDGSNKVAIVNEEALRYYGLYCVKEKGKIINPYLESEENITQFTIYKKK